MGAKLTPCRARSTAIVARPRSDRKRGQSMVEFALVAPIFFFLVLGILEFGVLMFDVTTTRFASGEGAKVVSQAGNGQTTCDASLPGCTRVFPALSGKPCYADCQAIVAIHNTALGNTNLEQVNYIEIQQLVDTGGGNFQPTSPATVNRYDFGGTPIAGFATYPQSTRDVTAGQTDYVQVNIRFTYRWLTGMFNSILASPVLDAKFLVRLEPQKF